jgi:LAO/AO transport system kinase
MSAPPHTQSSTALELFVERIRSGEVRALARAISAIEDNSSQASPLMKALFPHSGRATVLGLTGSPGAGKSTLVDQLAREYRKREKTIGIVAVDPTSPYTGGAILGDRIRMQAHHADNGIYIRSMATRGFLGGLAPATADVATLLDAAGKDIVLIETVGVGQDEIDIVRLADVTIVILVPGMGDDVQTIKAGIMEIADIFVINKSDREGAERIEREIRVMQTLAIRRDDWTPPIIKTVATDGAGVPELLKAVDSYQKYLAANDLVLRKKASNWRERLVEMLRKALLDRMLQEQLDPENLTSYAREIAEHRRDPYTLVEELVSRFGKP